MTGSALATAAHSAVLVMAQRRANFALSVTKKNTMSRFFDALVAAWQPARSWFGQRLAGRVRAGRLAAIVLVYAACMGASCGDSGPGPAGGDTTACGPPDEPAPVHCIGRFDAQHRFAWPGSAMVARFSGTQVAIRLDEAESGNFFEVVIDGNVRPVLRTRTGDRTYVLADDLGQGEHDVAVTRRTESRFGITRFVGFSDATFLSATRRDRVIEIVGDSITCGYGVLGESATCRFSPDTEAETHAWGALAGAELGADVVAIAQSGKGLLRNRPGDSSDTMSNRFERIFPDDETSQWTFAYVPDVVVIALGTNDFVAGDPEPDFVTALAGFVAQVRGHYPQAWILLAQSPMLVGDAHARHAAYLEQAAAAAASQGDERVAILQLAEQSSEDGYGCDAHPSRATQRKMARVLVDSIRARLDW